ncbi:MAG: agmatinase [Patescibacteria group bacterium]|jgi:agmatinase
MPTLNNYGGLNAEYSNYKNSRFVILPVPYDETSTWGKGADRGPKALIEASQVMELYDIESDSEPYKAGIFTDKPVLEKATPEKMVQAVEKRVSEHLKNKKIVALLGGEHSVSFGAIKANALKEKISVLHLDAHSDMRDSFHGSIYNHGCVMARAKDLCPIVQVGIRSMDISEKKNINKKSIFFASDIYNKKDWIKKCVSFLKDKVYISLDLDVFDPSVLPSTGTPEPGGLDWYLVQDLLEATIKTKKIVGFDVVELAPNKIDKASDFLAAKLVYKIISYINKYGK